MGAFSFKKKKKLKLRKREELAKPEGYRVPWSDTMSPLKIGFEDCDPHRNGMKFIQMQLDDGSIDSVIFQEGLWRCLTGDAPQELVDRIAAEFAVQYPDGGELPHDDEIRAWIQQGLESHYEGKVILPPSHGLVELMPTTWTVMLVLDLYGRANELDMTIDGEADLVVSGYELFARGVLDQYCTFKRKPLEPSPEDRKEFADFFDLLEGGNATQEANKQALRIMMPAYDAYLSEFASRADEHPNPDFKAHLENNIRAVRTWMVERMIELGNIPEGTTVGIVNRETGEVENLVGPAPTDEWLEKNAKQIQKQMDAQRKREVA
jgi:hypothetical protein